MDEQKIRDIVRSEINLNARSGSPLVPYHTHDGINSPKISQSGIVEFLPLPTNNTSVGALNNISAINYVQTFDANRNVYILPLVTGGIHGAFNGGDAPDGTLIGINTGGGQDLALCIDNTWYTVPLAGGSNPSGLTGAQSFTSGGTFTVPAGVSKVWVRAVGGGQGGGYAASSASAGSSGSAGDYVEGVVDVTGSPTFTVTVGSGGAGASSAGNGASGGDSSFGSLVVAKGGSSGTTSVGDLKISSASGTPSLTLSAAGASTSISVLSAEGGSNPLGRGGPGAIGAPGGQTAGNGGHLYGGGGSGGASGTAGLTANGGDGAAGLVMVIY